jgi:hypothetical protein
MGGAVTPKIDAFVKRDSADTVSIAVYGTDEGSGPELIGYLEITLVPKGARVEGWNADDSEVTTPHMILHA